MNDYGILSSEILVSKYVLIPLVALYDKFKEDVNPKRALYWFILATWDGRYSGASDTILCQDLKVIDKSPTFEDAINELRSKLDVPEKIDESDVLKDYRRDRFMRFLLYLAIFNNDALDWRQKVRVDMCLLTLHFLILDRNGTTFSREMFLESTTRDLMTLKS